MISQETTSSFAIDKRMADQIPIVHHIPDDESERAEIQHDNVSHDVEITTTMNNNSRRRRMLGNITSGFNDNIKSTDNSQQYTTEKNLYHKFKEYSNMVLAVGCTLIHQEACMLNLHVAEFNKNPPTKCVNLVINNWGCSDSLSGCITPA
jgi:hypothetical protein